MFFFREKICRCLNKNEVGSGAWCGLEVISDMLTNCVITLFMKYKFDSRIYKKNKVLCHTDMWFNNSQNINLLVKLLLHNSFKTTCLLSLSTQTIHSQIKKDI